MLQIAVCDDEQFYRDKIQTFLKKYCKEHALECSVEVYCSGEEFLKQKENRVKYDIIFMDIDMEGLNGIQTAMQVRQFQSDTYLVFVTAFVDYALEGYKVNAVRYIMKDTMEASITECMDAILKKMQIAQVQFSFMEGDRKLYTDNILYVESRRHKSVFYCMESDVTIYQIYDKLDAIEQKLNGYGFLRIHKSYLVNMKHIKKISNYEAFLDTEEILPVPRMKYQSVKAAFVEYKGAL